MDWFIYLFYFSLALCRVMDPMADWSRKRRCVLAYATLGNTSSCRCLPGVNCTSKRLPVWNPLTAKRQIQRSRAAVAGRDVYFKSSLPDAHTQKSFFGCRGYLRRSMSACVDDTVSLDDSNLSFREIYRWSGVTGSEDTPFRLINETLRVRAYPLLIHFEINSSKRSSVRLFFFVPGGLFIKSAFDLSVLAGWKSSLKTSYGRLCFSECCDGLLPSLTLLFCPIMDTVSERISRTVGRVLSMCVSRRLLLMSLMWPVSFYLAVYREGLRARPICHRI